MCECKSWSNGRVCAAREPDATRAASGGRVTPSLVSEAAAGGRTRTDSGQRRAAGEAAAAAAATVHKLIFPETCLYGTRDAGR